MWITRDLRKQDEIADLIRFELELWHAGVSSHDSFSKRFLKRLNVIALVQVAKWRRDPKWTRADLIDRMTARAIKQRQVPTVLDASGIRTLPRS